MFQPTVDENPESHQPVDMVKKPIIYGGFYTFEVVGRISSIYVSILFSFCFPHPQFFRVQVATSSHHWQGGARKVRGENPEPC